MAGPWEKYGGSAQPPQSGPWAKYQSAPKADMSAAQLNPQFATATPENEAKYRAQQDNAAYEALPGWAKPLVAADDIVDMAANGATFGFARKGAAGLRHLMTGKPYEEELANLKRGSEAASNRSGWAGTAAELTGGVGTANALGKGGLKLAGRFGTDAMTGLKGLLARSGLMAGEGAGYGAVNAAGNDQDITTGALLGAGLGTVGNVLGEGLVSGVSKIAGAFNKKPAPALSMERLNANKKAAYDLSEKAGVLIKPEGMKRLLAQAEDTFTQYDAELQTGAAAVLRKIRERQGQNITLKGLDEIRKMAGNAYQGPMAPNAKTNNAAVSKLVAHIDDLIDSNDPALMAGLDTKVGTQALKVAREYAKRAAKRETANNLIKKGNLQADRNITDTRVKSVKSQLAKINDPFTGWGRGFTAAEKEAAATASRYTPAQRMLHGVSGLNPFGGGKLSAMSHIGAAAAGGFNPAQLALQGAGIGVGMAAQKLGERLAAKSVEEFVDLVARGGVPAPVVKNALQRLTESKREAITRALMGAGVTLAP